MTGGGRHAGGSRRCWPPARGRRIPQRGPPWARMRWRRWVSRRRCTDSWPSMSPSGCCARRFSGTISELRRNVRRSMPRREAGRGCWIIPIMPCCRATPGARFCGCGVMSRRYLNGRVIFSIPRIIFACVSPGIWLRMFRMPRALVSSMWNIGAGAGRF